MARMETVLTANLGAKGLYLYHMNQPVNSDRTNSAVLQFQSQYGELVSQHWYTGDKLILGFSHGYLVMVSTGTGLSLLQHLMHGSRPERDWTGSVTERKLQECSQRRRCLDRTKSRRIVWRQCNQNSRPLRPQGAMISLCTPYAVTPRQGDFGDNYYGG